MNFNRPRHPLYDQLCKKASEKLPSLGFIVHSISAGRVSFISKDDLIITIRHEGYDMPNVLFGNSKNESILRSWGPLEYYINNMAPVYRKHAELKSFYDFEYDYDLLSYYYKEILEIVKNPNEYREWQESTDSVTIFNELKA